MPKQKPSEEKQARQFAVILLVLTSLLASGFYFLGGHPFRALVTLSLGVGAFLCSRVAFPVWLAVFRQWMKFARFMSLVISTLILTVFFYVIFTPIVLAMRLSGKKMLDLSWREGRKSYWLDKKPAEPTLERYRKQF